MSDNKAKDGEHGALALLALAALKDNRLEVMRYSETNVPDMGQDIFLTASNDWVQQTGKLAISNYQPHDNFSALILPPYSSPRPSRNKPPGPLMAPAALVRPAAS